MVASGDKTEEYREIKQYWVRRLVPTDYSFAEFDVVKFTNGYSKDAPTITLKCRGIEMREGRPEWGAEAGKKYFVIKLGNEEKARR